MSASTPSFKYDIAFSFHSKDEGLATALNDKLQDRFATFIYSERQKQLSGKDGEQAFNSVFAQEARFVVVFCRKEWGETPFTRIEQTAIRNRAFNEGYDFTLFIPTDTPPTVPVWLPKPRLYFGLERFGLDGAAAVTEARVQEMGGEPRPESVADRAARLQRSIDLGKKKFEFQNSEHGVQQADAAYEALVSSIRSEVDQIKSTLPSVPLQSRSHQDWEIVGGLGPSMTLLWQRFYSNTLDNSVLRVELHSGPPRLPGLIPAFDPPTKLRTLEFVYELVAFDKAAYVSKKDNQQFSPEALAAYVLREYMNAAERHKTRR
jgi:hypothetical protein